MALKGIFSRRATTLVALVSTLILAAAAPASADLMGFGDLESSRYRESSRAEKERMAKDERGKAEAKAASADRKEESLSALKEREVGERFVKTDDLVLNGAAKVEKDQLVLTDGGQYQASSAFFKERQDITSFNASFTYQAGGDRLSDGIAFVLQNDKAGVEALGGMGGHLGYAYMGPSAAFEMNIYNAYTIGTNFRENGQVYDYNSTGKVDIASGNQIRVELAYDGLILTEKLTDLQTNAIYLTQYKTDLKSVLGDGLAYIGFTGGSGGTSSIQTISDFRFSNGSAVPEPQSLVLLGAGLVGLVGFARSRSSKPA